MILRLIGLFLVISGSCTAVFGYGYALHVLYDIPYMQATKMSLAGIILGLILMLFMVDMFFSIKTLEYNQRQANESRQKSYTTPD